MLFSHWFTRAKRSVRTYRPEIGLLEDRVVPALLRPPLHPAPVPAATHLQVIVPTNVESGKVIDVIVEAEDAHNRIVPGFHGIVSVALGTADPGATLPASFTFAASDHGKHTIEITFQATGMQFVTVHSGALAGSAHLSVNAPVTHFSVNTFGNPTAGAATLLNVVAMDANNHAVIGYTGAIHFTSTDYLALLPDDYTFTAAGAGSYLFLATFANPGPQTLSVNDVADGSIVGGTQVNVITPMTYPTYPTYGLPGYSGYYYPSVASYNASVLPGYATNYAVNPYANRGYPSYYASWGWSFY